VLAIGLSITTLGYIIKREHARIEAAEGEISSLNSRLAKAINEIARNEVADKEWRKRVEENHVSLTKADEDRRGDARKIYDKIEATQEKIQRLAEKVAEK
jgi:uncharacterized protein YaaR (DUF327 family)